MLINSTNIHPSAFISSTFLDLKEERKVVADVLRKHCFNINALDIRPASNSSSKSEILKGIKNSDFIILIAGERYGSIIPAMTGSEHHSITKWEYLQARLTYKKDIIVFFKENSDYSPHNLYAQNERDLHNKQNEFKNLLSRIHNPKPFSTLQELAEQIDNSLINIYRDAVIDLTAKFSEEKRLNSKQYSLIQEKDQKYNELITTIQSYLPSSDNQINKNISLNGISPLGAINTNLAITNTGLGLLRSNRKISL